MRLNQGQGGIFEGGPGSGPHKVGDRVVRNYKMEKRWKDTTDMRDHNHGTVISMDKGGVRIRSDAQSKVLKDPNADKFDKKDAERGTFYQHKELLPEKSKESMEPFKPQDGDKLQKPRMLPVEDHNAAPRRTGRMNPRGYGANKKEGR